MSSISRFKQIRTSVVNVDEEIKNLRISENSFLLNYANHEDFFMSGQHERIDDFNASSKKISENLNRFRRSRFIENDSIDEIFWQIDNDLSIYKQNFNIIATNLRKRGDENYGFRKRIESNFKTISNSEINDEIIQNYVSRLRNNQNNYFIFNEMKHYNEFFDTFNELEHYLRTGTIMAKDSVMVEETNLHSTDTLLNINDSTLLVVDSLNTKIDSLVNDSISKNSLLTADSLTIDSLHSYIDSIQQWEEDEITIDENLRKTLGNYKRNFISVIDIDKEIGMNRQQGLKAENELIVNTIYTNLKKIEKHIEKRINTRATTTYILAGGLLILLVIAIALLILRISNRLETSLQIIQDKIAALAKGKIPKIDKNIQSDNEFMEICNGLQSIIKGQSNMVDFTHNIIEESFDAEFTPLSDVDKLGNLLIELRNNMKSTKNEEEKLKIEESRRNWATSGVARFSDILRQSPENLSDFGFNIIVNLVEYVGANVGGIFLLNESHNDTGSEEQYLELIASYAYDRRKFHDKKILLGEGLVGTAAREKKTIYRTEIPKDYIKIATGLGESQPRSLVIAPLKKDDKVQGVIELAARDEFEKYKIDFIEDIAEDIASTLVVAKINRQTAKMLEKTQRQSDEMMAQEEELRQNLEELKATQEAAAQREAETKSVLSAIEQSTYTVEYSPDGTVLNINNIVCDTLDVKKKQVIGRNHRDFISIDNMNNKEYKSFWENLRAGKTQKRTSKKRNAEGKTVWLSETYTPILDPHGKCIKVLNIAYDISRQKSLEVLVKELERKLSRK